MKCKRCGAVIHEGDTFCRTCASPVEDFIDNTKNDATINFSNYNRISEIKQTTVVNEEVNYTYKNNNVKLPKEINNKELINKDPNNRLKATIINIGELLAAIIIIFIVIKIVMGIVSSL